MKKSQVAEALKVLGIDTHGLVSVRLNFGAGTGANGELKTVHIDKTVPTARAARVTRRELIQRGDE